MNYSGLDVMEKNKVTGAGAIGLNRAHDYLDGKIHLNGELNPLYTGLWNTLRYMTHTKQGYKEWGREGERGGHLWRTMEDVATTIKRLKREKDAKITGELREVLPGLRLYC